MTNEAEKNDPAATPAPEAAPAAATPTPEAGTPVGGLMDRISPVLEEHAPEAHDFLAKNGRSLLVGVAAAALVFVGASTYRNYKASAAQEAETLLFASQSPESIQKVIDDYGSTPVAPLAQLTLAAAKYDAGEYDVAEKLYAEFLTKFPRHLLRDLADFNRAVCQEAAGRMDDALTSYTAFAGKDKQHYLQPEAVFGRARCLEQLNRYPEAKAVLEDFVAANPTNAWGDRAEATLLYVDKAQRATLLPKPALAPVQLGGLSFPAAAPGQLPTPAAPAPSPAPAPTAPPAAKP